MEMTVESTTEHRLEIPGGLTPDLVETLCLLEDAPPGVAEATIALLPYGSRSNLAAHGIVGRISADRGAATAIEITEYGWSVIAACAQRAEGCGDTDDHPAVASDGRSALVARWRSKAEAADRELSRMKAQALERVEDLRSGPHASH